MRQNAQDDMPPNQGRSQSVHDINCTVQEHQTKQSLESHAKSKLSEKPGIAAVHDRAGPNLADCSKDLQCLSKTDSDRQQQKHVQKPLGLFLWQVHASILHDLPGVLVLVVRTYSGPMSELVVMIALDVGDTDTCFPTGGGFL